jgi:hypothetical protein
MVREAGLVTSGGQEGKKKKSSLRSQYCSSVMASNRKFNPGSVLLEVWRSTGTTEDKVPAKRIYANLSG